MDATRVSALLTQLNAASDSLHGLYERLPRYVVSPLTRDDVARRDDLILQVEEAEAQRAGLVEALMVALRE